MEVRACPLPGRTSIARLCASIFRTFSVRASSICVQRERGRIRTFSGTRAPARTHHTHSRAHACPAHGYAQRAHWRAWRRSCATSAWARSTSSRRAIDAPATASRKRNTLGQFMRELTARPGTKNSEFGARFRTKPETRFRTRSYSWTTQPERLALP